MLALVSCPRHPPKRTTAFTACIDETAQFDLAWPPPPAKHDSDAIHDAVLTLLHESFTGLHRRALLFFGRNIILEQGGEWIATQTHYVGNFDAPLHLAR
ncbi:MAG: hypothetical protein ABF255_11995 [Planktotalea arctica]